MNQAQFLENLSQVHAIFEKQQLFLNTLPEGIKKSGENQNILDAFLDTLGLPKNEETRYIASARIKDKKFEPLDIYLEKLGKDRQSRDEAFEISYREVQKIYESLQEEMLIEIKSLGLLPDFYMTIFEYTHTLGKAYSDFFVVWNRALLFGVNRELESRFGNDQEKIIAFLRQENLFDRGHHELESDRSYSVLEKVGESYISRSYSDFFPKEVGAIVKIYEEFLQVLSRLEDEVYEKKDAYLHYFETIMIALKETRVDELVARWSEVDIAWMEIDTPIQPGHPIEYYDDKYRRAVAIEFDIRVVDPSLFESRVSKNIEHMYEAMYDEIGRENFSESYHYSLNNQKKVQLYIGAPILAYGSFLCGSYSAQVVPNDDEVSKIHGKKIFAFPKYVLEAQRKSPKMKLDTEIIHEDILEKYEKLLAGPEEKYYEIYDIETIGHEFGHTLWLAPRSEVEMNQEGLLKNIEEFKATAGGLVAYFLSGGNEFLDEAIVIKHLMRCIRMLRYAEVEDILPYYCECLIHLHIFFASELVRYHSGKIELKWTQEHFSSFKEGYTSVYTQQIFTYLNKMEAGNFLFEFVQKINGIYLPCEVKPRIFVEEYYKRYKEIGNEVA